MDMDQGSGDSDSGAPGVEVVYATPARQALLCVAAWSGGSIREAIECSGMLRQFPEIVLEQCRVGVFGRLRQLDDPVQAGDRVEIYRPLTADPKQARRLRVKKKGKSGS